MTSPNRPDDEEDPRRRLAHDIAGQAYPTAVSPTTGDGRTTRPREQVASRSTEEEARDLLALRRAKRGDTASFAELLQANDLAVRAFLSALVGPDDLDAVCTQVYLRAFRGLPIAPTTSPRIWLLGIADGAARDLARRTRQSSGAADGGGMPIPLDLPADERLVLAATEAVGLTHRETARLTEGGVDRVRELTATGRRREHVRLPLEPPLDHAPRFWSDLGRRLLIEQSAPAATGRREPTGARRAATDRDDLTGSEQTANVARGMAVRVEQQHPRSFPWRRVGTAAAVVVTVAAIIGFALSLAGHASRRDAGLGDTALKTLDRLDASLARNTVVQGTVRITSKRRDAIAPGTYRFVRSNTGSWRVTAADASVDEGYDVAAATATLVQRPQNGDAATATIRSGLAPGPPEATGVAEGTVGDVLANVVRAVRGGTSGTVETRTEVVAAPSSIPGPTTTDSRPVWVVTSALDGDTGRSPLAGSGGFGRIHADEAELVADQSLALPTQLTLRRNGTTVVTVRFSALSISQQPTGSVYLPPVAPGIESTTTDAGFVPTAAGQHTGVGRAPTPSYLPGGYVLAAAAVNRTRSVTVVCYRNGSRQLVLTARPAPSTGRDRADPFPGAPAATAEPAEVNIESGSFAGASAYSSIERIAHVWVNGPQTQVVATGDPTVAQLTKVLASLR
jgi:DNA-directed RNA polymerase specialized sigma24 family protein